MGWQWHHLDHMQIICTSLQTDNHASTSPLSIRICIRIQVGMIRTPLKFNRLFDGPLPTSAENFMQIRSEVSAQSC